VKTFLDERDVHFEDRVQADGTDAILHFSNVKSRFRGAGAGGGRAGDGVLGGARRESFFVGWAGDKSPTFCSDCRGGHQRRIARRGAVLLVRHALRWFHTRVGFASRGQGQLREEKGRVVPIEAGGGERGG